MCTVIISNDDTHFIVGANRDERLTRQSSHFSLHDHALYPVDVVGGTWIGVNDKGMFAAITNRDDTEHVSHKKSRGILVKRLLQFDHMDHIRKFMDNNVDPKQYNGFNIIVFNRFSGFVFSNDRKSINHLELDKGLHVITGYGIDTYDIPRCAFIKRELATINSIELKRVLSSHICNDVLYDVCIHDPKETHQTRSSCIISADEYFNFNVEAIDHPPCTQNIEWDKWMVINRV